MTFDIGAKVIVQRPHNPGHSMRPGWSEAFAKQFTGVVISNSDHPEWIRVLIDEEYHHVMFSYRWWCDPEWVSDKGGPW